MKFSIFACNAAVLLICTSAQAGDALWAPVQKSLTVQGIGVNGRTVPEDGAMMMESARVQGRVLSVLKREGETVREGDFLYAISSSECSSLTEEKRLASKQNIAELIGSTEKRERQLGLRLMNDQCFVVANHAGTLTKRNLETGSSFNLGDPVGTILDVHHLTVELDIPERDYANVRVGQKVTFQFASQPTKKITSRLQTVVPTIDPITRSIKARLAPVRLPSSVGLDALVFGDIQNGSSEATLKVPPAALVFHHNQQYVVTGSAEKPKVVAVEIINENNDFVSIRSTPTNAIKMGDKVLIKGAIFILQKLKEEG